MGIRLSEMKSLTKTGKITWEGTEVDFAYHPGELTLDLMDQVEKAGEEGDRNTVGALLEPVLEWWDVLDEDGQRIPTDADTIKLVALSFTTGLIRAIREDNENPPD